MRILLFIDSLGSGGAQRQLVNLAIAFKSKGFDVSFLTYNNLDFYSKLLSNHNIPITTLTCGGALSRIIKCRRFIRRGCFDAVISFLETPSFISEMASIPFRKWKLIIGERSAAPRILNTVKGRLLRFCHLHADFVVSNSYYNQTLIRQANPFLPSKKCKTIYNLYDTNLLSPEKYSYCENTNEFRLVVVASHQKLKNLNTLAEAICCLSDEEKKRLKIHWYGERGTADYQTSIKHISDLNVQETFSFFDPTNDIYSKMSDADAVGLFSIYEGLPNTLCEAMCLGKVIVGTDVSDNKLLIRIPELICDPNSPQSIAASLSYLLKLTQKEKETIGASNREFALKHFSEDIVIEKYIELFI